MSTAVYTSFNSWFIDYCDIINNNAHGMIALGFSLLINCKFITIMANYFNLNKLHKAISSKSYLNLYRLKFLLPSIKVALSF